MFDDLAQNTNSRQRVVSDDHGIEAASCLAHVTSTVNNGTDHHAFFANADDSQIGADGQLWFRYTTVVPYAGQAIDLSLFVDHFQNFSDVGATGVYVDQVSINLIAP